MWTMLLFFVLWSSICPGLSAARDPVNLSLAQANTKINIKCATPTTTFINGNGTLEKAMVFYLGFNQASSPKTKQK